MRCRKLLWSACIFFVIVVLGECGLRLVRVVLCRREDKQDITFDTPSHYPYYDTTEHARMWESFPLSQYSPYLAYKPKPNTSGKGYRLNSNGFRTDHELRQKAENEVRIFFTGGSTAWGVGVPQDRMYTACLERILRARFKELDIKVISAGMGSYNSTQERILLNNEILSLEPDIVVMFSGWNDTYQGYKGEMTLREQDAVDIRRELRKLKIENVDTAFVKPTIEQPRYKYYHSKILYVVDLLLYRYRYRNKDVLARAIEDLCISPDVVCSIFERNIRIADAVSKEYGFDFIALLQPTAFLTSKKLNPFEQQFVLRKEYYDSGFPEYNAAVYAMYRERLANEDYVFLDCDKAFTDMEDGVFVDYVHFGDRGNKLIAEFIAPYLIEIIAKNHRQDVAATSLPLPTTTAANHTERELRASPASPDADRRL